MEEKLASTHVEHTGAAMLPRQITFWAANISNGIKSFQDFCAMISKQPLYRSYKAKLFRDMVGASSASSKDTDDFFAWLDSRADNLTSTSDIETYVKTSGLCVVGGKRDVCVAATAVDLQGRTQQQQQQQQRQQQQQQQQQASEKALFNTMSSNDEAFIESFERVFGRPMYVHEFFKHRLVIDTAKTFETQQSHFQKIKEIMHVYLDEDLGEYEYVKKFMHLADEGQPFFERLLLGVIESDKYKTLMEQRLSSIHMSLYDVPILTQELAFLFERVKVRHIGLDSDDLSAHVMEFKGERDDIVKHLSTTYMSVLNRQPDVNEVIEGILFYRHKIAFDSPSTDHERSIEAVDAHTVRKLVASLEFHEVLKTVLKDRYGELTNQAILPSQLYPGLKMLLEDLSTMLPENIVEKVDAVVSILEKSSQNPPLVSF